MERDSFYFLVVLVLDDIGRRLEFELGVRDHVVLSSEGMAIQSCKQSRYNQDKVGDASGKEEVGI
jgi:hypothetical protein